MATITRELSDAPAVTFSRQGVGSDAAAQAIKLVGGLVEGQVEKQAKVRTQTAMGDYTSTILGAEQQKANVGEQIRQLNDQYLQQNPNSPAAKAYLDQITALRNSSEQGLKGIDTRIRAAQAAFRTNNPALMAWANGIDGAVLGKSSEGGSGDAQTLAEKANNEEILAARKVGLTQQEYQKVKAEQNVIDANVRSIALQLANGDTGVAVDFVNSSSAALKMNATSAIVAAANEMGGLSPAAALDMRAQLEYNWVQSSIETRNELRKRGVILTDDMNASLEFPTQYFDALMDDVSGPVWQKAIRDITTTTNYNNAVTSVPILAKAAATFGGDPATVARFSSGISSWLNTYTTKGEAALRTMALGNPDIATFLDMSKGAGGLAQVQLDWSNYLSGGEKAYSPTHPILPALESDLSAQALGVLPMDAVQVVNATDLITTDVFSGNDDAANALLNPSYLRVAVQKNPDFIGALVNSSAPATAAVLTDMLPVLRDKGWTLVATPNDKVTPPTKLTSKKWEGSNYFSIVDATTGEPVRLRTSDKKRLASLNGAATLLAGGGKVVVDKYIDETINSNVINVKDKQLSEELDSAYMHLAMLNARKPTFKYGMLYRNDAQIAEARRDNDEEIAILTREIQGLQSEITNYIQSGEATEKIQKWALSAGKRTEPTPVDSTEPSHSAQAAKFLAEESNDSGVPTKKEESVASRFDFTAEDKWIKDTVAELGMDKVLSSSSGTYSEPEVVDQAYDMLRYFETEGAKNNGWVRTSGPNSSAFGEVQVGSILTEFFSKDTFKKSAANTTSSMDFKSGDKWSKAAKLIDTSKYGFNEEDKALLMKLGEQRHLMLKYGGGDWKKYKKEGDTDSTVIDTFQGEPITFGDIKNKLEYGMEGLLTDTDKAQYRVTIKKIISNKLKESNGDVFKLAQKWHGKTFAYFNQKNKSFTGWTN